MSKTAILSLFATLVCAIAYYIAPHASSMEKISAIAIAILVMLFFSAMVIGRRFQFDPRLD